MLELKNITKDYPAGDGKVQALKGVSLQFRQSEFVSILGPSGCGKTTMLNIIGGLDQYTSGDLVINGASKKNVSNLFNAETIIIGFASGGLGVLITKLLCYPINAILHHFTGISSLNAYLPWQMALVLIAISVVLTMFAGLIPSRSAAKKDPVVALRSE